MQLHGLHLSADLCTAAHWTQWADKFETAAVTDTRSICTVVTPMMT